ncbi:MAG: hypothetical protein P8Y69_14600, partial [Gammaproteobacteria bacterium]
MIEDDSMFDVEKVAPRVGRENIVIVSRQGRRVGSASVKFVQWMHDCVPRSQLQPEQIAMVDWYGSQSEQIGAN